MFSCARATPTAASAHAASVIALTMCFIDWFWFELDRDQQTRSGQGREANLLDGKTSNNEHPTPNIQVNFRQAQTPVVATGGASVLASRFRFNLRTKAGSSVALYLFFALQPKTLQGAAGRLACLPAAAGEDKTVAIVAYLTLIGFIAATIIHSNKKTKLGAFHLRQMLGFMLTWFAVIILIIIPIVGWILIPYFTSSCSCVGSRACWPRSTAR